MTKAENRSKQADRDGPSRPEDPDTQRLKRSKRLLRNDMLPDGAALVVQAGAEEQDSETKAALKRATGDRLLSQCRRRARSSRSISMRSL
jgi:hypothetical protein